MSDKESLQSMYDMSVGPGQWVMDEPVIDPRYPITPDTRIQGVGASVGCSLVDENSELLNITRNYSRCPEDQYLPGTYGVKISSIGLETNKDKKFALQEASNGATCGQKKRNGLPDCALMTENTRLTTPLCTTKEQGYNRWDYLHFDPQKNVSIPFDHNIDNSIIVKDNHRPCIPVLLDQSMCLPRAQ